jgi:nucleotide-binding universal stress UspA family protein
MAILDATVLAAELFLKGASADPAFAGLEVEYRILRGAPERALASHIRGLGNAMLVIQTHGKSGLDAFWDGSAASRIVTRLRCPVLLVPAEQV